MIRQSILTAAVFLGLQASSQTLFTYGNDSVSVQEFLQAYEKNNTSGKSKKAMQEYMDLYITARLKIKEAKARGYDTLPNIVSEMQNLRAQILPSYLNDPQSMNKLVNEAFNRSQKDIHLLHIFIPVSSDTSAAYQTARQAYQQLQKGSPFGNIARQFSSDPSATVNGGDLGYITAFSLPYELENLAYSTPVGRISPLYRSKAGYHIFKNAGERKAMGRMRAAQILLAFPPDADESSKRATKKLADSLYTRLLKGDDFGKLAAQFSADPISSHTDGRFPEFGVGQFDAVFEAATFAIPKDGAITKPFATTHGYHIIKRLDRVPVNTNRNHAEAMQQLKDKVQQDEQRNSTMQMELVKTILQKAGYKILPYQQSELKSYTSQTLDNQTGGNSFQLKATTPLFQLGSKNFHVDDWITYARNQRTKTDGSNKTFEMLWDEFMQSSALDYYKENLEAFNAEFRNQLTEFKEGNLFFEIMQKEVWGPAQSDTVALRNYYQQHKEQYTWNKSADVVVFYASDAATAQQLLAQLKKTPANWRELVGRYNEKVTADSARLEWSSIPGITNASGNKSFTQIQVNKADNTASFAYIIQVNDKPIQRSFDEARGAEINDYGAELEKKWVEELKKKYPVNVNNQNLDLGRLK